MSAVEMNFHVRGIGKTWPRATVRLPLPSASSTAIQHSHNGHLGIDFRQLNVGIIKSTAKRPQNVFRKLAASANKLKRFEWKSPQCDQVGQSQQSSVAYCAPRCLVPSSPLLLKPPACWQWRKRGNIRCFLFTCPFCCSIWNGAITITFRPECNMSGIYVCVVVFPLLPLSPSHSEH